MLTSGISPSAFADAALAAKSVGGHSHVRFDPALEAQYVREHLIKSRALILVTCVVASLAAILRGAEQLVTSGWGLVGPIGLPIVVVSSLALTALAASPSFESRYLPWARVVVPLRNIIVAAHIAAAAKHGQLEMLMILPLALIGPFFFMGFNFRLGLLCAVLTSVSFVMNAVMLELPLAMSARIVVFLLISLVACTVIAKHVDKWSRAAFLETRLNAELAQHDPLTGTKNRRVFDEHLLRLWPKAIEERRGIAILLIDVDHFKSYNDHYGHQAGDDALRRVAQAIQTFASRPLDVLARYGGEEFAAVLHDVDEAQALQVAERMRRSVAELNIEHEGSRAFGCVTVSVGVAAINPTRDRTVQGVLQLADQALYQAKLRGRNRIETMSDEQHKMLVTGVFSLATAKDGKRA
jgi:diguanylate cyclase (GGDEF)-like protein